MNPLSAFQGLAIAMAAAMAVEALRATSTRPRAIFWALFIILAIVGITTNVIASSWPKASGVMAALGSSPITLFVVFVGWLIFLRKPWQKVSVEFDTHSPDGAAIAASALTQFRERIDQAESELVKLIETAKQELQTTKRQVAEIEEKLPIIIQDYQTVSAKLAQAEERDKALEIDLGDVRRGCATLEDKVTINEKCVRESLYAISAREQLQELAAEIEQDADDLYRRLKAGENYTKEDWDKWTNVEHHWERSVKRWVDVARWYAKDVKNNVLTVDDKEYDDAWDVQDKQFPTADAVRRFKRHRIIHRHWQMMQEAVEHGLQSVAFQGGTEKEQHCGRYHQQ